MGLHCGEVFFQPCVDINKNYEFERLFFGQNTKSHSNTNQKKPLFINAHVICFSFWIISDKMK